MSELPLTFTLRFDEIRLHDYHIISHRECEYLPAEVLVELCRKAIGQMAIRMSAYVAAMPSERWEIHEQWPADWWQAFRERWFPTWWLRRWPVQYRKIDIDKQLYGAVCPHLSHEPKSTHMHWFRNPVPELERVKPLPTEPLPTEPLVAVDQDIDNWRMEL